MRVLVLEDDPRLSEEVTAGLRGAGFAVDVASDIADADFKIAVNGYDCLVVDRGLPDGDGLDLVADTRAAGRSVPALILTARDGLADRIAGFENGADDYLAKPFALPELILRVRALCRRRDHPAASRITVGDIEIDLMRRRVHRAGILLTLTPKEFAVLERLATHPGATISRTDLIECCWDEMADPTSNVVDAVVAKLRRKLGPPSPIETIRGTGFLLNPDPTSPTAPTHPAEPPTSPNSPLMPSASASESTA
ncbi:response regulator transcription factor [Nocardia pseudobrasiliensis]|uniref:Winged helix family two component transcriptional regulator n=1 Tax=Nocardia pseudobrasiliensis TaxID=45979 RepID=A0A370IEN3_9NOCA|nr:response regulator transcription factor [Nocardia pseudobrasiliensis]RDI69187.1 winged helix family two component transcriptional regulator [Nocardia pseudobrasiliensis]